VLSLSILYFYGYSDPKVLDAIYRVEVNSGTAISTSSFSSTTSSNGEGVDVDESSGGGKRVGQANLYTQRQLRRFSKQPRDAKCIAYFIDEVKKVVQVPEPVEGVELDEKNLNEMPPTIQTVDAIRLTVYCGFDDGVIAAYDLSQLVEDSKIRPLEDTEKSPNRPGYSGKRICKRSVGPAQLDKSTIPLELKDSIEKYSR
jgi:hypothetical protein